MSLAAKLKLTGIATGLMAAAAVNADLSLTPLQVGGFYAGGGADNLVTHQNYFVGYGTSPGSARTAERRSFFWYHIPTFAEPIIGATIKLKMAASTSMIFGYNPATASLHDETETFQLGFTPVPPPVVTDPAITPAAASFLFDTMNDVPIASPLTFSMSTSYDFPFTTEIHLDGVGLGLIDSHRGGDIVITGWMPSWSENLETDGSGHFLEAHELLYGLSDIPGGVPAPELHITTVPEPTSLVFAAMSISGWILRRRRAA